MKRALRPGLMEDLDGIVETHCMAFKGFFLTSLGPGFLRRLYRCFIDQPSGICIMASNRNGVAGFVAGTSRPTEFFRRLFWCDGLALAFAALPALSRSPLAVARRVARGVTYRGERPKHLSDAALISSIAVQPELSGSGIGSRLLEAFCQRAAFEGCSCVYLITDRDGNSSVNRLYERNGFEVESTLARRGQRQMSRYIRVLTPPSSVPLKSEAALS